MDKVTSLLGLGGSAIIDIVLDPHPTKKFRRVRDTNKVITKLPIYVGEDDISGTITVKLDGSKKLEHLGIRCELIGRLEIYSEKTLSTDFMVVGKELEPAGSLTQTRNFTFKFAKFEKQYETFKGVAGEVKYFVRVTINRNYNTNIVKELYFAVHLPTPELESEGQTPIKMEVGIEECLHIEFNYTKSNYHLKDVLVGQVSFQLVKLKIKCMEIGIERRQTFGTGPAAKTEKDTLVKFEAMDGCPAKGEVIPIRLFFSALETLTPSYKNINNRLSVKYAINLILIDEEDRRYFKQHEITVYRKK